MYAISVAVPTLPVALGSLELADNVNALAVSGDELYAATDATTKELVVVDISVPALLSEVGSYNAPGGENGIAVDIAGSTLVLGRENGSNQELMVFDVSSPSPLLQGTGEVGDSVFGVSLDGSQTAYLATGESGMEFMRWDISTPTSPVLDASLNLNADALDIMFSGVNAFVASAHDTQELQIIGEGSTPGEYVKEASFTSQAFDAGGNVSWEVIEWTWSGTGSVSLRVRTADSQANLSTAQWVGSDGTPDTTYSQSGETITTDPGATGTRWIEWRAYLSGSGSTTPSIADVTLRYTP